MRANVDKSIYSDGWRSTAGQISVTNPADQALFGTVGLATVGDVARAAESARSAQKTWFARPYEERAAVLRNAAELLQQQAADYTALIVRESGSVQAKATFEIALTVKALLEAAAMPSQPQGYVLPTS